MRALERDIRVALEVTRLADAAPAAIRQRGRQRLMSALAAGSVVTSVAIAQGAGSALSSASMTAGTAAGSTLSLAGTLVSAVVIGLSSGLVALSPTSKLPANPSALVAQLPVKSEPTQGRGAVNAVRIDVAALKALRAKEVSTLSAPTAVPVPEETQRDVLPRHALPPPVSTPQPEEPALEAPGTVAARPSPIKASIARELELIAEVRRALISGHTQPAIVALDRHAEEFPAGALAEEATASRVVALCALGRVQEGQRWAAEFRSRYPNSPQLNRVRSACPARAKAPSVGEAQND